MGERIAIVSGKGGTGKTALCAGVAVALAQAGKRVLCIDCDTGLRNLDIFLGMAASAALSFSEVCQGHYPLEQAAVHPELPNLSFLTAPMNCGAEAVDGAALDAMLRQAQKKFDYILLDAPAGVGAGFRLAARCADRCIVAALWDPASVRNACRAGQELELMGKTQVRMVVSRVQPKVMAAMKLTVDDVMDQAGLPLLGIVPEDPEVCLAAAADKYLTGKRGAAAAYRRIAQRIQGISVPVVMR